MKKIFMVLAAIVICGMLFTGCKKSDSTTNPDPTPTPTTLTVMYKVDNTQGDLVVSDCFKLNVTYTNADGQSITENGITLPWTKSVEVTPPFNAKMEGEYVYNEAELPDVVVSGKRYGIGSYTSSSLSIVMIGTLGSASKENFLNLMASHPDRLKFTMEKDF